MIWEQLRRGPEFWRGNQEGFDDFEGIGVIKLQLEYSWFDDFLSVNQVNLLPDCTSLLSGSRDCLFELARISKIFGCLQRIFCFNSSNKTSHNP